MGILFFKKEVFKKCKKLQTLVKTTSKALKRHNKTSSGFKPRSMTSWSP